MPTSKDLKDLESQSKVSKISAANFKKQGSIDPKSIVSIHTNISSLAGHIRKTVIRVSVLEKIVQDQSKKITSLKNISKLQGPQIRGTNIGEKLKSLKPGSDDITEIKGLLDQIIEKLTLQNKDQKKATERSRRESESARRSLAEAALEKGFKVAIQTAEKVIAPVKSLLRRIIDFFMAIFWGKVFLKLLDWFADPANKKKIDSLFRFFGDHWPKLLALYLRFGTGFGKAVGKLTNLVFFGTRKLLQVVASMVGAKAAARFLGGRGGKLVQAGLQVATTVGTTMALSGGIESFVGSNKEENPKTPTFNGGGLANLKRLFGYLGGGSVPGFVSGEKGIDKIPAMLSDGEFVMSRGAVQKYGVNTLEAMNAAGGGTNRPKMISGKTYAAGGGLIGYAGEMIKNHEALSSLEPGQNYYVSMKSPEYKQVTNNTKIYPYLDSVNVPTIGWGSTYYDSLLSGTKKVKMSDPPITKAAADNLLQKHLSQLIPLAKSKLPLWNRMSPQQQGTIVSFLYNAGPNSIDPQGPYPRFSKALISGNMQEAARNNNRGGPPISRINEEKRLLTTGPTDLTKSTVASKPKKQPGGIFEQVSSGFSSLMGRVGSIISPPAYAKEPKYAEGGKVLPRQIRPLQLSKAPARINKITPLYPSVQVATMTDSTGALPSVTGTPGTPNVPSFSATHRDGHSRRLQIAGIA